MSLKWVRFFGSGFLLLTQTDNNPGIYADAAARDVYFATPNGILDLARMDANEFLIIKLLDNGSGQVAYQQRQGAVFVDVTSLVQGEPGSGGQVDSVVGGTNVTIDNSDPINPIINATGGGGGGASSSFESETARDVFFTANPGDLKTDLHVIVTENEVATLFRWTGADSPGVYDPTLFETSSLGTEIIAFGDQTTQITAGQPNEGRWFASPMVLGDVTPIIGLTGPTGVSVPPRGDRLFAMKSDGQLNGYSLTTPWDSSIHVQLGTITLTDDASYTGLYVLSDLSRFFVLGAGADEIIAYDMTIPGDVTTAVVAETLSIAAQDSNPRQVVISSDGTKAYYVGGSAVVFQYDLPLPFTLTGASFSGKSFSVASVSAIVVALGFSPDGRHMYVGDFTNDSIHYFKLTVAWEVDTAIFVDSSERFFGTNMVGVSFNPDGTRAIIADNGNNTFSNIEMGIKTEGKILYPGRTFNSPTTFEIHSEAEWEALAVAGVITISSDTTIKILASIGTLSVINIVGGNLLITGDNDEVSTILFIGPGPFITITGDHVFRTRARVVLTGTASGTFMAFTGETILTGGLDLIDTTLLGWADLGTIVRGFISLTNTNLIGYSAPFKLTDSFATGTVSSVFGGVAIEFNWNDPTYSQDTTINLNGFSSFTALVRVSPFIPESVRVLIPTATTGSPNVAVFDTSGGSTGTYTAVANAQVVSEIITAVTDSNGEAAFFVPIVPKIGQIVTISGFIINTAYNGTFKIASAGPTAFIVADLSTGVRLLFGTNEPFVGSIEADGISLTSVAHGLSNGEKLQLSSNLSTTYDGGYEIYDVQANTFSVNAIFDITQTGTWDTSPLNQANPNVLAFEVVDNPSSHYIACAHVNNNTNPNGPIVNNTFTNMIFGTVGNSLQQSTTTERWKLVEETTGVFEYTGNEPFDSAISFDFTVVSSGGTVDFRFKWEIDTGSGFVNLPDDVEALVAVGSDAQSVTKKFPLKANKGDQIRPRITRNSGTSGITTSYATIFAGA